MNKIISHIALASALGLVALVPSTVEAQTTFTACRVPDVGAIYMIGVTGAPTACLDASHVEFSWTEGGGGVGPGDIGTTELADDAVTSAKILDGSVGAADLDPAAILESGVEFGGGIGSINPTDAPATALSVSVSHPGSGYIVAHAIAQITCSADTALSLGITTSGTNTDGYTYHVAPVGVGVWARVVKNEVIPVTGAGTTTLNFNVDLQTDNCGTFRPINFDAIYVANRY